MRHAKLDTILSRQGIFAVLCESLGSTAASPHYYAVGRPASATSTDEAMNGCSDSSAAVNLRMRAVHFHTGSRRPHSERFELLLTSEGGNIMQEVIRVHVYIQKHVLCRQAGRHPLWKKGNTRYTPSLYLLHLIARIEA